MVVEPKKEPALEAASPKKNDFKPMPNKPFLPKAKDISISYQSSLDVQPGADSNHQFYKIHPYGVEEVLEGGTSLIPQYPKWGYAFLSFKELPANSSMTLFFGVKNRQGTVISEDFTGVCVEYLTDSGWTKTNVQSDSTYGLNKTGIISFQIGNDASSSNTIMPIDLYWIRVGANYDQVSETSLTMIGTNAVQASRVIDVTNEWETLENIDAGKIKNFIQPIEAISKVTQPFPSFGGEEPETKRSFRQRVARRINHKERASSIEHIQSIILDKFKEIYQINVVPGKLLKDYSNEDLLITVVPKIPADSSTNLYQPIAEASVLNEVLLELNGKINEFLKPQVEHPGFEQVLVSVNVVFKQPDQYFELIDELSNDLALFLSPWIEDNLLANRKEALYINDLIRFISSRDYVESFEDLAVYQSGSLVYDSSNQPGKDQTSGQPIIYPSDPRNILVSADKHNINCTVALPDGKKCEYPTTSKSA